MAKCEKRELKPEPPPVEYVLTLTEDEAMAVCMCIGHFGGEPDPTESVWEALELVLAKARKTFRVDRGDAFPALVRIKK